MIQNHHAMLSPVLDVCKVGDEIIPHGNHSMFQKLWQTEIQDLLKNTLQEAEASEKEVKQAEETLQLVSDAMAIFLQEASNPSWTNLTTEQRIAKTKAIQEAPQIPQRSEEWYRQFGKVLTASEFSALFSFNKRRKDLVYSKANPPSEQQSFRHACPTDEMNAIGWGIRFEPVIKQLLEYRDKCKIYEPGRLSHPTNTHLAASPDGLILNSANPDQIGRLVEIKCPYSRSIGKEIPSDYWIQMQIQMEVTDIDECEYVECDLVSKRANQKETLDLSGTTYQGNVYLIKQIVEEDQPFEYKYLYGDIGSIEMPPIPEGYEWVETIPWGLKAWHRKIVHRDRAWYEGTKTYQEAFWRDVEAVKKGETLVITTPKLKPTACLITDD